MKITDITELQTLETAGSQQEAAADSSWSILC
jgi:hypothetical protein